MKSQALNRNMNQSPSKDLANKEANSGVLNADAGVPSTGGVVWSSV